jgi:hypothetical protein
MLINDAMTIDERRKYLQKMKPLYLQASSVIATLPLLDAAYYSPHHPYGVCCLDQCPGPSDDDDRLYLGW